MENIIHKTIFNPSFDKTQRLWSGRIDDDEVVPPKAIV
ncbi:hypothetical protein AALP_AA6G281600 [Arabis alpina]|uniref:Uncharacterized protein n=1 Tax=Arabis alpina TaxID=50452 RepID=A0A087GS79_ARAAL|nr:hypothetical protein AALP_AA6G281600 [Arabis alpina]